MNSNKRPFNLDFTRPTDADRLDCVEGELESMALPPTTAQLELFADYILYGKSEDTGLSGHDTGHLYAEKRKYTSYTSKRKTPQSLDALVEVGADLSFKPLDTKIIDKPQLDRVDRAFDKDIPYMTELWASMDHLKWRLANEPMDQAKRRQLTHWYIDLATHQYYLKDSYAPKIRWRPKDKAPVPPPCWTEDTTYSVSPEDYAARTGLTPSPLASTLTWTVSRNTFDITNPLHLKALYHNYSSIYEHGVENLGGDGLALCWDLEAAETQADLLPEERAILTAIVDGTHSSLIPDAVYENTGIRISSTGLSNKEQSIYEKIALAAKKEQLLDQVDAGTFPIKVCAMCGARLPAHTLFFGRRASNKDGLVVNCIECVRARGHAPYSW